MPSPIADHLADRFAADAAALRARAAVLRNARGLQPGPSGQAITMMAEACDRVRALFVEAESDDAVRALLPMLAGLVAGARNDDERAVYAGAVSRTTQALDGDDDEDDDAPDADDGEDDA